MKKEKWNPNDWQGRRKEQVEGHAIMALISIVGLMGILMVLSLMANQNNMSIIQNDIDYWKVEVNGEEWIVDGVSVKDVVKKVLVEEPDADIDLIERTNIMRVIF